MVTKKNGVWLVLMLLMVPQMLLYGDIIQPEDIERTHPYVERSFIQWVRDGGIQDWITQLMGGGVLLFDPKYNPEIPPLVHDAVNTFSAQFSGILMPRLDRKLVKVHFENAPRTETYGRVRSVVFSFNRLEIALEANSRTMLSYRPWYPIDLLERTTKESFILSSDATLTKEQVFAKAIPILDYQDLSTQKDDYRIFMMRASEFRFRTEPDDEPVDESKSVWVVRTIDTNADVDTITLGFGRSCGRLIGLIYRPSDATIQQWYEYQNTGKEQ